MINIYVDCITHKSVGLFSFVFKDVNLNVYNKVIQDITQHRLELIAVISVLRYLAKHPELAIINISSNYVIGIVLKNWKINANRDLWRIFFYFYYKLKNVEINYISDNDPNIAKLFTIALNKK